MGSTALLPLWRKACWGFFRPKNPTASAGFEPANLGTKGQHATPRLYKIALVVTVYVRTSKHRTAIVKFHLHRLIRTYLFVARLSWAVATVTIYGCLVLFRLVFECPDQILRHICIFTSIRSGDHGSTEVKALCYKSEGRWFDPSWCHWNFSLT